MNELIEKLHEEGCSCVVSNKEVRTYTHRGVDDLYRLLTQEPTFLDGAEVADRVVGKAAAAMMVKGGVKNVSLGAMNRKKGCLANKKSPYSALENRR